MRVLREAGVDFEDHLYTYVEAGGTAQFSRETGVPEHLVIKTLVMEDEAKKPIVVLMHGDREVSLRKLAREIGVKQIRPCSPEQAERHSGYQVGGTSPFGTRRKMRVYCEASIAELPTIYINGGKRGYIVSVATHDMLAVLRPSLVRVAR